VRLAAVRRAFTRGTTGGAAHTSGAATPRCGVWLASSTAAAACMPTLRVGFDRWWPTLICVVCLSWCVRRLCARRHGCSAEYPLPAATAERSHWQRPSSMRSRRRRRWSHVCHRRDHRRLGGRHWCRGGRCSRGCSRCLGAMTPPRSSSQPARAWAQEFSSMSSWISCSGAWPFSVHQSAFS
jgi:hypothetical protein